MKYTFVNSFEAAAAVPAYRLMKFSGSGSKVGPASAATDAIIGASTEVATAQGAMADAVQGGWADVQLGGTVAAGDPVTSDATGRAIKAVPTAGSIVRYAGFAQDAGIEGDIVPVQIEPGLIATPA